MQTSKDHWLLKVQVQLVKELKMWIEESYPKMIEIKAKFAMLRSSYHVSEKVILEYILDEELY